MSQQGVSLPLVEPIRPVQAPEVFDDKDWLFEMKYDGYRGVAYIERSSGYFISRQGKRLHRFDSLCERIAEQLGAKSAIFDGEIISFDLWRRPVFNSLQRRGSEPIYVAFDLLWLNGTDLRKLPLKERRKRLEVLVPDSGKILEHSIAVQGRGTQLFELMCKYDLEGIVAKRLSDPYRRWTRWVKIKNPKYSQEQGRAARFNRSRKKKSKAAT